MQPEERIAPLHCCFDSGKAAAAKELRWSLQKQAAKIAAKSLARSPRGGDEDVVGGRSSHGAPSSRGDAAG